MEGPGKSDTGRGLSARRLAWYVGAWAALSAALVLAVMMFDPSPGRPGASPPRSPDRSPVAANLPRGADPATQQATAAGSLDWRLDLAYTPVQRFHHGRGIAVTGCSRPSCAKQAELGSYPSDFIEAVRAQGTGKITSGAHTGKYLGWAAGVGFWLDTAPRDSRGDVLRAFSSAVSGTSLLSLHTRVRILTCGLDETGDANSVVCAKLQAPSWTVTEVPNPGPTRSLTLYIGLEPGPDFTGSAWATTFSHAVLRIG
jgi:hypothetical protein